LISLIAVKWLTDPSAEIDPTPGSLALEVRIEIHELPKRKKRRRRNEK
jgi:hypothetical protein